jgi:hypothetical protein
MCVSQWGRGVCGDLRGGDMKKNLVVQGIIWLFLTSAANAFWGQSQAEKPVSPLTQERRPQAAAASGEGFWDDRFFHVDGSVEALVINNGILYAGGHFTCLGGIAANSVAQWDGTNWSALGSGISGGFVGALAVSGTDLYAGVSAGSSLSTDIYKWDGTTWTGIHSGYGGHIKALAFYGADLYAVGYWFPKGAGTPWHFFIKWDGTTWSTLDSAPSGGWSALAVSGPDLYVGGNFTEVGGVSANHVAKWNGTTWSALGSGISGGGVSALAVFGPDLFVGGSFTEAGGVSASYIAKWDGTSWSALGSGMNGSVGAFAVLGSDLYAGGVFTTGGGVSANHIAKWDGTNWSALGSGISDGGVFALAASGPDLYVGGAFAKAGGVSAENTAKWNENAWSAMGRKNGLGMDYMVSALAASGPDIFVGGKFSTAGGVSASSAAKWNGTNWSVLGTGTGGGVSALAVSGTDLYAGGVFTTAGGVSAKGIAKWDGTAWAPLGSGIGGWVYALAVSGTDLYAGGDFVTAGGVTANGIAKWNGTAWSALGSGIDGQDVRFVYALAVLGPDLYVGGSFMTAGGISANGIAKWDGANWSALGSGISGGGVLALAVSGTDLYVGGSFTTAGGITANGIAKWDGANWSALGSGMDGQDFRLVSALTISGKDLYAGGSFTTAGGILANHLAKWDGTNWSAVGSGMDDWVYALAISGPDLYAGGDFTTAGGVASSRFAIWHSNLVLTSPVGGEFWVAGMTYPVTWAAQPIVGAVKLEYSIDGGTNWTTIIASTPNDGSYDWVVPNSLSTMCLVRVSDAMTGIPADISNEVFSIVLSLPPTIGLSRSRINFGVSGGISSPVQSVLISNAGGGTLNWTAVPSETWITLSPQSGMADRLVNIGVNSFGLSDGYYTGTVLFSDPKATNSAQAVSVHLTVYGGGDTAGSFGSFDTPIDGLTVSSSIAVTGWALDDIEVAGVKIYRNRVEGESTPSNSLVYIGDAVFVKGARPDVETKYSGYPLNDRAGWGYMLLTNGLPDGGNGTYTLQAIATDKEGNQVSLGQKTITCDNRNAVKPFGAIDTPGQGGTASGSAFINFAWALTPQPNSIPTDGSTLMVYVDGLPLGHPAYNFYRVDIATLFPGYANSTGAVGYYSLNTSGYVNGVHTLAWLVTDSGGNADGIGSRYFMVQNVAGESVLNGANGGNFEGNGSKDSLQASRAPQNLGRRPASEIAGVPEDWRTPVYVKRGYKDDLLAETVFPEMDGSIRIQIPEVTRIMIYLNENETRESEAEKDARSRRILSGSKDSTGTYRFEAYELVQGELRPLPIGASFDSRDGAFFWQPGPGFLGEYQFVIIDKEKTIRKTIKIMIVPARESNK